MIATLRSCNVMNDIEPKKNPLQIININHCKVIQYCEKNRCKKVARYDTSVRMIDPEKSDGALLFYDSL